MALSDGWQESIVAGRPLLIKEPTPETNLATFPGKVVTGDYNLDSNPLLSAWIGSDLTGGHGVEDMNESLDAQRYRLGTFYTRFPGQITKAQRARLMTTSAGDVEIRHFADVKIAGVWWNVVIVGDYGDPQSVFITQGGANNSAVTPLDTTPVNNGVVYRGTAAGDYLVVPMGADGIGLVSATNPPVVTNIAADSTHPALQAVVPWDYKLIGVDTDGQLWYTTDPTGAWTSYGATALLPASAEVRNMVNFFDRSGNPTVFVVTDTDVWQFDANGPTLFTVDVFFPPHPYHGLAAVRFGGDLYFSVGMGVHRYTGGVLAAIGLDRDHGLPIEYNGYIIPGGLVSGYNALLAFVTGPDLSNVPFAGSAPSPISSVHEYSGGGWHMLWESSTERIVPYSPAISRSVLGGSSNNLLWSTVENDNDGAHTYSIALPIAFTNPRQISRTTGGYQPNGWMESSIFDAGMKAYQKTANAIDILISNMKASATFTVKYKINGDCGKSDSSWTTLGSFLGSAIVNGSYTLPFGAADVDYGTRPGMRFERIQFRFELADNSNDPFVWEGWAFSYLKTVPASLSYTIEVDGTKNHAGFSPEDNRDFLHGLVDAGLFVPVVVRGVAKRCFVSQVTGTVMPGSDERHTMRVSLVEVPVGLNQ